MDYVRHGWYLGTLTLLYQLRKRREWVLSTLAIVLSLEEVLNRRTWLLDLGCKGCSFTWNRGSGYERLGRVLCNSDWRLQWHQAEVHHLPRTKSDHCPILVQIEERNRMRFNKPFQFHMAWLTHEGFSDMVIQNWLADPK